MATTATTKRLLLAVSIAVVLIALIPAIHFSGILVGASILATKESGLIPQATTDDLPSPRRNAFVEVRRPGFLDPTHFLQLGLPEINLMLGTGAASFPLLEDYLLHVPPNITFTSIVISGTRQLQGFLLPVLWPIQVAIRTLRPEWDVKVAPAFSLPQLKNMCRDNNKDLLGVVDFLKESGSFLVIDIVIDGKLDFGDELSEFELICQFDVHVVVILKVSAVPIGSDLGIVAGYADRLIGALDRYSACRLPVDGVLVEVLPSGELNKQLDRVLHKKHGKVPLKHFHRELLTHNEKQPPIKVTDHDLTYPVTNPVTTPISVPATTNPTQGVVTIPATNPVTVLPTNPFIPAPASGFPYTNPVTTTPPATYPPTNPFSPVTIPDTTPPPGMIPVTNPVTTPATLPLTPITNPVTSYPFPPPAGGVPDGGGGTIGGTVPGMVPIPNTGSGQTWCVAKTGASDAALQMAIDYACGIGGADCLAIQETGVCYNPNTLRDHASYAFNSYYQKNPTPSSCDFGGTAMIVNVNPSVGSCVYPASSSSLLTPNTYPAGGSTTVFGSTNPLGSVSPVMAGRPTATATSNSISQPIGLSFCLTFVITLLYHLNSSSFWSIS